MIRRAFLRRMAFAAAACAFLDVPLPKEPEPGTATEVLARLNESDRRFTALLHEIYMQRVVPHVNHETAFLKEWDGHPVSGDRMIFPVDLRFRS